MRSIFTCVLLVTGGMASLARSETPVGFQTAQPIWPAGRETEMNLFCGFRAVIEPTDPQAPAVLRVAASPLYRAWLNGKFLGHGPARGPHGYYRVDELDLTGKLQPGRNVVAIEVAGYNVNSYYVLDQPAFLQAEVKSAGKVLAATGDANRPFAATVLEHRVQKVQRYSFQRAFIEVYRQSGDCDRWRSDATMTLKEASVAVQTKKELLPRVVLYPDYAVFVPKEIVGTGRAEATAPPAKLWKDRALVNIGPDFKGYREAELAVVTSTDMQKMAYTPDATPTASLDKPIELKAGHYAIADLELNSTAFIGLDVHCQRPTRLYVVFDEILSRGDVDFKRLSCVNVVSYELSAGDHRLESFEPYTFRYLKLIAMDGDCEVRAVYRRDFSHPSTRNATFECDDARLNKLYKAGVETFRQNSLDLFMDCPSRERAGWLCDSFFTARVACDLTGTTLVERNFCENFLRPERFAHLPEGMFPMCYPSDHYNGNFIPNWALWFVVQLEEYASRTGDRASIEAFRPRVLRLFEYFKGFENSDGLLEKLPAWVFVEWSAANKFVQDVNYPSNMLYAGALSAAGRLYQLPEMREKADRVRQTVLKQSFDGQFFVDNAVRREGKLQVTRNRTEVCQYFAFYFGVADRQRHAELWQRLHRDFGPKRAENKLFPEVHPANSFIGNVLRLELLSQAGLCQQILDESIDYLYYMAERTGTLWENTDTRASCNHGFASHVVHTLYRDVLGLYEVDRVNKQLTIRPSSLRVQHCQGTMPTADGPIEISWKRGDATVDYRVRAPANYRVRVENNLGPDTKLNADLGAGKKP